MTNLEELQEFDNRAFDCMQRNNVRTTVVRRCVAENALDQYYEVIEALARQEFPQVWNEYNPWDFRRKV